MPKLPAKRFHYGLVAVRWGELRHPRRRGVLRRNVQNRLLDKFEVLCLGRGQPEWSLPDLSDYDIEDDLDDVRWIKLWMHRRV
jgi:hypothetical protein